MLEDIVIEPQVEKEKTLPSALRMTIYSVGRAVSQLVVNAEGKLSIERWDDDHLLASIPLGKATSTNVQRIRFELKILAQIFEAGD